MVVFPNAKINIGLDILRRRPDGYHDISTVMVPVPWCDILEIVPAKGSETTLTVTGRAVDCPAEKNLVMKAYRHLDREVPLPPVDIYLHKIIPDGAGLGGGSADATFTLRALNEMFSLDISDRRLAEIAAGLGADCPFFVYNRPMLAEGIGERQHPVDIPALSSMSVAIVKPPISISTAEAYANIVPAQPAMPLESVIGLPPERWQGLAVNAFQRPIARRHHVLERLLEALRDAGAVYTSMSGSGSAVFGLWYGDILAEQIDLPDGCDIFCGRLG